MGGFRWRTKYVSNARFQRDYCRKCRRRLPYNLLGMHVAQCDADKERRRKEGK